MVRFASLEDVLGQGGPAAALERSPALLNHCPATLRSHFHSACALLPSAQLALLARKQPWLLTLTPFRLWTAAAALAGVLGCSEADATALAAARQPRLLALAPSDLQHRHAALTRCVLVGVPRQRLQQLLRRAPSLLTYHPRTLAAKGAALQQLLGGVTPQQLAALLARQPALLTLDVATMASHFAELRGILGLSQQQLALLLRRQPGVLGLAPASVAGKLAALQHVLRLPDQQAASQMAALQPVLLTYSPATLEAKLALLGSCTAACAPWAAAYAAAPASRRAYWACFSAARLGRLQRAVQVLGEAAAGKRSFAQLLRMTDEQAGALLGSG